MPADKKALAAAVAADKRWRAAQTRERDAARAREAAIVAAVRAGWSLGQVAEAVGVAKSRVAAMVPRGTSTATPQSVRTR
jgi:transposase